MNTQISVPIDTETFLILATFLRDQGSDADPVEVVTLAISYWMENAAWKQEDLIPGLTKNDGRGFTWKNKSTYLFMPDGTRIRMKYKGEWKYAQVVGDEIVYEGEALSPSVLANRIAGSSRNAWRDLWIKIPSSEAWTLADDMRAAPTTSPVEDSKR